MGSFLGDRTLLANTSPFYGVGPVDLEPGGGAAPVERLTLTTRSVLRTPRAGPASLFCDLSAPGPYEPNDGSGARTPC